MMPSSKQIITEAHTRFNQLEDYGFDWRSFYNGYLEGTVAKLSPMNELTYENCIALTWQKAAEGHRKDIAELNARLMERQETMMKAMVDLKTATQLLTRCRNAAGRVEIDLYEDVQNFIDSQPSYRC